MKLEIKDRKKNPLMKREEVMVSIDHSGKPTPNRKEVMGEAAKLLNTRPENLIVTKISTSGGTSMSEARVHSYSKKEDIPEWKVKKFDARVAKIKPRAAEEPKPPEAPASQDKPAEEPTKEGAGAEAAPEEKPPEEKKDEASGEEKPGEEAKKEEPKQD